MKTLSGNLSLPDSGPLSDAGFLRVFRHPLIEHNLAILRDKDTDNRLFRETLGILSELLVYEITRTLPTREVRIDTPLESCTCRQVDADILLVPVLRAGLGMATNIQRLLPTARTGHIGLYRDEKTHAPVEYYCKLPPGAERMKAFVLDPMLATGGSLSCALDLLKRRGLRDLTIVSIVSAPQGIAAVHAAHPEVPVYTAALDRTLNADAYILPGLGDCGDRIFGTI
jgi:uracil phosphoribosyltransferase